MKDQGIGQAPVPADGERLLVSRLRERDEAALEEVIRRYGGKIYYLALQYTRSPEDAEEVLQDVFLKAYTRIETFRAEARLSPWLYKIAVNTALMKLRDRRKRRPSLTVSLEEWMWPQAGGADAPRVQPADPGPGAEEGLLRRELQQTVRRAIERLPEIYRTVVLLRDIDGLSLEEVADVVGISVPAVKSRLHRARLSIHKSLSRRLAPPEASPLAH